MPLPAIWKTSSQAPTRLTLPGVSATAYAVNAAGVVVGSGDTKNGIHALLWEGGTVKDLLTLGGASSTAYGINDSGDAVGVSQLQMGNCGPACTSDHATIWRHNQPPVALHELAPAAQTSSRALGINNPGTAVGSAQDTSGYIQGVVWTGETVTQLPNLGGKASGARAINNAGHIVGQAMTTKRAVAAVWVEGKAWDLNELIVPAKPNVYLTEGRGITNSDDIVAVGFDDGGRNYRVYLLTPR